MELEKTIHESFGQVSFNRCSSTGMKFYGSEMEQNLYVTLEIKRSEIQRELTQDRHFDYGPPLIKVRMSSNQFSELITSMNIGGGVPCTIERFDGKKVEDLPIQESRKDFVHNAFKERMKQFGDKIKSNQLAAKDIVKKKTLSKNDIETLKWHIDYLTQEIEQNIPFFAECFQETMDKVVLEAKTEVENAIQHKINVLGLDALHEQNKLLK